MLSLKEFETKKIERQFFSLITGGAKIVDCTETVGAATLFNGCPDEQTVTTTYFTDGESYVSGSSLDVCC